VSTEAKKELDPFLPLRELNVELFTLEGQQWQEFVDSLGIPRQCEMHDEGNPCNIRGCLQLRAFRRYIRTHKQCEGWRRWQAREQKRILAERAKKGKA